MPSKQTWAKLSLCESEVDPDCRAEEKFFSPGNGHIPRRMAILQTAMQNAENWMETFCHAIPIFFLAGKTEFDKLKTTGIPPQGGKA